MIETAQSAEGRKTARQLLLFLEEMMRTIARVDLGDPGVAQLTLLEMRILLVLVGAAHLLGRDLDRLSSGLLAA
jgi:hypothetical protein